MEYSSTPALQWTIKRTERSRYQHGNDTCGICYAWSCGPYQSSRRIGWKPDIPRWYNRPDSWGHQPELLHDRKLYSSVRYLEKQQPMQLEDFHIESFEVPMTVRTMGYCIEIEMEKCLPFLQTRWNYSYGRRIYQKGQLSDIGSQLRWGNVTHGYLPQYLKERITSRTGHMSNIATAEFLSKIWRNIYSIFGFVIEQGQQSSWIGI